MATFKFSVLGPNLRPDTSGNVYQLSYDLVDTGAVISPFVWVFAQGTTKDGLRGEFIIPQDYVGTAKMTVLWVANATSGAAVFDLSYLARTDAEDMGAAATDTTDTVTTTTDATAFGLNTSTMTLTAGDFAAGDIVVYELFRDQVDAADTLTANDVAVFDVLFEYADV